MSESKSGPTSSRTILRVALLLLVLVGLFFTLRWLRGSGLLERALGWIKELGPWGPVVFIIIFIVAVVFFVPASVFTLGAGFVFGMAWGSVYVVVAAVLASNITFLIARHWARDWMTRRFGAQPKFKSLDEAVAREGWKIVALVRLAPVFPFSVSCYAFGLTRIPLWEYFLASFAMIPSILMYVYFGSVARDLTATVATPPWIKWTIGALAVLVVLYITRFAQRALSQKVAG